MITKKPKAKYGAVMLMSIMDGFQFAEEFQKLNRKLTEKCKIVILTTIMF
jgi:hypothetical protein